MEEDRRDGPPREREPLLITPERWSFRGEAVIESRSGRELHIWQGIPGEQAKVRVIHQGRNQSRGKWLSSRRPDPRRVEPPCDRYNPCGGCPLMHLNEEGQRMVRRAMVRQALQAEGLELEVEPVVAAPKVQDFRHLIKLGAGYSEIGRPRLGAFGREKRDIVPIPHCLVTTPELREAMKIIAHHMLEKEVWPYQPERGTGLLRYVVARQSMHTGEILVTLVGGRFNRLLVELAEAIEQNCASVVGVHLHMNDGPGNAIFSRDGQGVVGTQRLAGREVIIDRLADVEYRIGPGDFFQTHPAMADRLYRDVIELSGAANGVPVVDLYSGVGSFALALAPKTGWAIGVESVDGAVRRARESASANEVSAEFTCGEVVEVLPELARRLVDRRPLVLVNPARRGLEPEVVEGILALDPRRLIYVSCNPQALARDLRLLIDRGWSVPTIRPYDMFPNTSHVEVVTVLIPPDGGAVEDSGARAPQRRLVRSS